MLPHPSDPHGWPALPFPGAPHLPSPPLAPPPPPRPPLVHGRWAQAALRSPSPLDHLLNPSASLGHTVASARPPPPPPPPQHTPAAAPSPPHSLSPASLSPDSAFAPSPRGFGDGENVHNNLNAVSSVGPFPPTLLGPKCLFPPVDLHLESQAHVLRKTSTANPFMDGTPLRVRSIEVHFIPHPESSAMLIPLVGVPGQFHLYRPQLVEDFPPTFCGWIRQYGNPDQVYFDHNVLEPTSFLCAMRQQFSDAMIYASVWPKKLKEHRPEIHYLISRAMLHVSQEDCPIPTPNALSLIRMALNVWTDQFLECVNWLLSRFASNKVFSFASLLCALAPAPLRRGAFLTKLSRLFKGTKNRLTNTGGLKCIDTLLRTTIGELQQSFSFVPQFPDETCTICGVFGHARSKCHVLVHPSRAPLPPYPQGYDPVRRHRDNMADLRALSLPSSPPRAVASIVYQRRARRR